MRILIVTDTHRTQTNGVVRTLSTLRDILQRRGHVVGWIDMEGFAALGWPTYPEIRLALWPGPALARQIEAFAPDAIHIATEGFLGMAARRYCRKRRLPFTTAFHSRLPEYLASHVGLPLWFSFAWLRWFHGASAGVMVSTPTQRRELQDRGFQRLRAWTRGVDQTLFFPRPHTGASAFWRSLPRPALLYVGRVAPEKNLEAFLSLPCHGSKVVVGEGPSRRALEQTYPEAHFLGVLQGEALAQAYCASDALVFPSKTDTFGLVMLEALACGTPVAAFPAPGPLDVIGPTLEAPRPVGALHPDLQIAVAKALRVSREACVAYARTFSWAESADQFVGNLRPFNPQRRALSEKAAPEPGEILESATAAAV
ncbi:MAG: glycosyltransferase family 1 protein [Vampirovibrionales bacterium]|nr:glycosyltransferase family 1 protein [Vampirovibrionales bacterium]